MLCTLLHECGNYNRLRKGISRLIWTVHKILFKPRQYVNQILVKIFDEIRRTLYAEQNGLKKLFCFIYGWVVVIIKPGHAFGQDLRELSHEERVRQLNAPALCPSELSSPKSLTRLLTLFPRLAYFVILRVRSSTGPTRAWLETDQSHKCCAVSSRVE